MSGDGSLLSRIKRSQGALIAVYTFFFGFFVYLLYQNWHFIDSINANKLFNFLYIILFTWISLLFIGIINYIVFRTKYNNLTVYDGFRLAIYNRVGNYLPLSAGFVAKGVILNRDFHVGYRDFAEKSLYLLASSLGLHGMAGLVILWVMGVDAPLLSVVFLCMTFGLAVPRAGQAFLWRIPKLGSFFHSSGARLEYIQVEPLALFLWSLIIVVDACRLSFAFETFGVSISVTQAIPLSNMEILSRLVSITPASIGIQEAIITIAGHLVGYNWEQTLLAVGVIRVGTVVGSFSAAGGIILVQRIDRRLK